MELSKIVQIDEKGFVPNAVNFGMMADPDNNLRLCEGFIFNYDSKKTKSSTVGIIDSIRRSYHSPNESNIHLVVQDYGKGKSHFALTLANFFSKSASSSEVRGIVEQIEKATINSPSVLEDLKAYKQRNDKHLVLCLSGDKQTDLKRLMLTSLRETLESEGITESLAQHVCKDPLNFLEGLTEKEKTIADQYLLETDSSYGDVQSLINFLREDNYLVIPIVKNISRKLYNRPFDFEADLDIEIILEDLIKKLCSGENPRFAGILILLDELNAYLQSWIVNPFAAGGMALQNITNVCANNKRRIALVCFAQVRPSKMSASLSYMPDAKTYEKLTSRLEESIYEPESCLELVLDRLLIQKQDSSEWKDFLFKHSQSLTNDSKNAYEQYITKYKEIGWPFEKFHTHLSIGCFPLHPLTSYLLSNLDFTQGRTALQFIKREVKEFISVELISDICGGPNYIFPYELVDAFLNNLSNHIIYPEYQKALNSIQAIAGNDTLKVLKSLFLFYISEQKLKTKQTEGHEVILSILSGLSIKRVREALEELSDKMQVIYLLPQSNIYRFYAGLGIADLRKSLDAEIATEQLTFSKFLFHIKEEGAEYNFRTYTNEITLATDFAQEKRLIEDDWRFRNKVIDSKELIELLNKNSLDSTEKGLFEIDSIDKGIFAYVLVQNRNEAQQIKQSINNFLLKSRIVDKLVIAIPTVGVEDVRSESLTRILLKLQFLERKKEVEKEKYGQAILTYKENLKQELIKGLKEIFISCEYFSKNLQDLLSNERKNPKKIVSNLLRDLYKLVPSIENTDKLRLGHQTGTKIVGHLAKNILNDSLMTTTFTDKSYSTVIDTVFVDKWKLLKKASNKYSVQEPTDRCASAAWQEISSLTELNGEPSKNVLITNVWQKLSEPPYGYDEFTFTVLFCAWLAYHRAEVYLSGDDRIPQKKSDRPSYLSESLLKNWADKNIFDKPKEFINSWVKNPKSLLTRKTPLQRPKFSFPLGYEDAKNYLEQIDVFLQNPYTNVQEVEAAKNDKTKLQDSISEIDKWCILVKSLEEKLKKATLDQLLTIYYPNKTSLDLSKKRTSSVLLTQQQEDYKNEVLQFMVFRISEEISNIAKRVDSITNNSDFDIYNNEVTKIIHCLKQCKDLSSSLLESLELALEQAKQKLAELRESQNKETALNRMQEIFDNLPNEATQETCNKAITDINKIVCDLPKVKEESIYLQIISSIERKQAELLEQIEEWEKELAAISSSNQANKLRDNVLRNQSRYTENETYKKIQQILTNLSEKTSELLKTENVKEHSQKIIEKAKDKLKIIEIAKLPDAIKGQVEFIQWVSSQFSDSLNPPTYQQELEVLQTESQQEIINKISLLCNRSLDKLENYENFKKDLVEVEKVISLSTSFSSCLPSIAQAIKNIELQKEQLDKENSDENTINQIRQQKKNIHNVLLCEQAISEIEKLSSNFHFPSHYSDEVTECIRHLQKQIEKHTQKLKKYQDQLITTRSLKDLSFIEKEVLKLDNLFINSKVYEQYQNIIEEIKFLKEDFELAQELEIASKKDHSVALCDDCLQILSHSTNKFHFIDRFQSLLNKLEDQIKHKKQAYIKELDKIIKSLEEKELSDMTKLKDELLKKSSYYIGSQEEKKYEHIYNEINALIGLSDLFKVLNKSSLNACLAFSSQLESWQHKNPSLSDLLQGRMNELVKSVEKIKQELVERQQKELRNYVKEQVRKCNDLEKQENNDSYTKIEGAGKILQALNREKEKYKEIIDLYPELSQSLLDVESHCLELQNSNRESQIVSLFQSLPSARQLEIYEKLRQYINQNNDLSKSETVYNR